MAVALDSDAVAGFLDSGDALHEVADAAIRELAPRQPLVVSVITYTEILTGARLGHHRMADVEGFFAEIVSRIIPAEERIGARAAELRARTGALRTPDALILATAEIDPEISELVTADRDLAKLRPRRCRLRLLSAAG